MQSIYNLIQNNPSFYAWAFGLVNVAWGAFLYFNKQRHERELKHLEQDLRYSADRRLKLFDLKASQYGQYVTDLDAFGKKNQTEMTGRMQAIYETYFRDYLAASDAGDQSKERDAIEWLSSQTLSLVNEGLEDITKLKYESNRLKLIATDEMIVTFEKIESLNQELFDLTSKYMTNFSDIIIHQKIEETERFQHEAERLAQDIKLNSRRLLEQMRSEINDI